jgi:hypothetical protein
MTRKPRPDWVRDLNKKSSLIFRLPGASVRLSNETIAGKLGQRDFVDGTLRSFFVGEGAALARM